MGDMKCKLTKYPLWLIFSFVPLFTFASQSEAQIQVSFQYYLANFSGPVKTYRAKLAVANQQHETFIFDTREKDIRIFNEYGMETYHVGEDKEFFDVRDLTLDDEGFIYILRGKTGKRISKLNFKGYPVEHITVTGISTEFRRFYPDTIVYRNDHIYLADTNALVVVKADLQGRYVDGYDIAPLIVPLLEKGKDPDTITMFGVDIDPEENIVFTVPVLFSAFRLSPTGKLEQFGNSGSSPGQFGVVAGIASDEHGFYYVTDRLRCVVMIFDKNFKFIKEFGHRGYRPANLIVPDDVAIDKMGNIYVSQAANRGVSVFKIRYE